MNMFSSIFETLIAKLADGIWYGESFAGFLFAAIIGGTIAGMMGFLKTLRYRGWKACIIEHAQTDNLPEERETLKLLPEEVRQILGSDLEGFRNVRSMVSGYCQITTANMEAAKKSRWLRLARQPFPLSLLGSGSIVVSLPDIPRDQLKDGKWNAGCEPRGWVDAPASRSNCQTFFISGHAGAHEWARRRGIEASHIEHLTDEYLEGLSPGDLVIGTLPVNLIRQIQERGGRYVHLSLNLPKEGREKARTNQGLSADEMDAYGATLERYSLAHLGTWRIGNGKD